MLCCRNCLQEFGAVKNIQVGVEKQTGYVAGHAVIEYDTEEEAQEAISKLNGTEILGKTISVDWAFVHPANKRSNTAQWGAGQQSRRRR